MAQFYTYLWLRENGTPYYAGKGSKRRAFQRHRRIGVAPPLNRIIIQEFDSEKEAFDAECFLISFYGRKQFGGLLCNLTDGGEGPSGQKMSPEWCRKNRERFLKNEYWKQITPDGIERMRQKLRGRKRPLEIVEKMRKRMLLNNPFQGKTHSEETRKRLSEAALKRHAENPGRLKKIGELGRERRWGTHVA